MLGPAGIWEFAAGSVRPRVVAGRIVLRLETSAVGDYSVGWSVIFSLPLGGC